MVEVPDQEQEFVLREHSVFVKEMPMSLNLALLGNVHRGPTGHHGPHVQHHVVVVVGVVEEVV